VITPRSTRLVRAASLRAFRRAAAALSTGGAPGDPRDRIVVVPTPAAGAQLLRTIEDTHLAPDGALLLPDVITAGQLVTTLGSRLVATRGLTQAEREVLLGLSCRSVRDAGVDPPFRLRPALIAEALRFYDALRRQRRDVDTFERLALGALEPGASFDRGAERLVRQTRFLVAAYRDFEVRCRAVGEDEHALRSRLLTEPAARPWRELVLTVTDRGFERHGLWPADWDLVARVPGLEQITLVVTDGVLAGALHERLHDLLPGIEEVRFMDDERPATPRLVAAADRFVHAARDREEEVALFARRVRYMAFEEPGTPLDAQAIVVRQPLPYVYVAREVLRSAGIPCQTFDALPLASEPYAAALDLVLTCIASSFARAPLVALLRSAQFAFRHDDGTALEGADVAAFDRMLSEAGYLGNADALARLIGAWRQQEPSRGRPARALRAGDVACRLASELEPLLTPAPAAGHLAVLTGFMARHERMLAPDDPLRARHLRARAGVIATLASFRDAYARFDDEPMPADALAALVRRGLEVRTFAPRSGDHGVHILDADAARFGQFAHVHLAGLVEGEWPEPPEREIFYSPAVLRDLGWPPDSQRTDAARAAFAELLQLPESRLVVSTFLLEADALVNPSPLVDLLDRAPLEPIDEPLPALRVFEHELLGADPVVVDGAPPAVQAWTARRASAPAAADPRFHGNTLSHEPHSFSLSALERYQDCAFKYFAADVLKLEEAPDDGATLSPRARGRFIHEVFQRFFEAWDARGSRTLTPDQLDDARAMFAQVADPLLAKLPEAEAMLERTRLFGSAIAVGIVDVVLGIEASRPVAVRDRWLEYRLAGDFTLSPLGADVPAKAADGERRVPLRGVADRIDLLDGRRLRVIDYKTGIAPQTSRALQVPIYALCAQERLMERDAAPWAVDEAAYVAFSGKRPLAQVVKPGARDAADTLEEARQRVFDLVDAIHRGEFAPRPHDRGLCRHCAYPAVCRTDDSVDA
jgi:RecB family exonuclease